MAADTSSAEGLVENGSSLQSIRYKRGSLQLLDQRKLPLETTYMDIRDSADGWSAIRDMVVRGAPAIAVAGALSLAVEVSNLETSNATSEYAASYLANKLDYLVSSLAVLAFHHHIPFYVAAPLTSIDLALSSGQDIVIEERSAKELLHSRGGLGEQVAASGISVWNPAFDVTPACMTSGIITEKGVITKKGSDTFDIKGFVLKATGNS